MNTSRERHPTPIAPQIMKDGMLKVFLLSRAIVFFLPRAHCVRVVWSLVVTQCSSEKTRRRMKAGFLLAHKLQNSSRLANTRSSSVGAFGRT